MLLCDQASVEHQSPQILFADAFPIVSPGLASLAKPSGSQPWLQQLTQQFLVFLQLQIQETTKPVPKGIHKGPFMVHPIFLQYTAGCLIRCAGCSRNHHRRCTCSWYCGCHRSRCGAAGGCRHSRQSLRGRSPWHTSRLKHLQMQWHSHRIWQKRPNNSNTMTELWAPWTFTRNGYRAQHTVWTESNGNTVRKYCTKQQN